MNRKEIEERYKNCNHLFLKRKEGETFYGFHSTDYEYTPCIVTCLKCGLTNEFIEMSPTIEYYERLYLWNHPEEKIIRDTNDQEFRRQFQGAWKRGRKYFDESVFNLISEEAWDPVRPMELYQKAIKKSKNATRIRTTFQIAILRN